jgi:DNA-binding CsgD family transcriptional regulator
MYVPVGTSRGRGNLANSSGPARIAQLVRLLIELVAEERTPEATPQQEIGGQEIILDTNVDGARYLLVRLPQSGRAQIRLSPREQEIVRMVAQGHPNKVIADVLNISSWTVCTHLRRIFAKLGVGSRAAMVAHVLEISRTTGSVRCEALWNRPRTYAGRAHGGPSPVPPDPSEWTNQDKPSYSRRTG